VSVLYCYIWAILNLKSTPKMTPKLIPNLTPKMTPNSTPKKDSRLHSMFYNMPHNGALKEIETSQEKSETHFWRSCCVD
jgi:hypothetical protein